MFRRENREEKECEERFFAKADGFKYFNCILCICYYRHTQSFSQSVS